MNGKNIMTTFKEYIEANYKEEAKDICERGCIAGVTGFIYYSETTTSYDAYTQELWDHLYEQAGEMDTTILKLLASFNGQDEVGSEAQFKNMIVWAYVEYVCSFMVLEQEEIDETQEAN